MNAIGARIKGKAYETKIAGLLGAWWSGKPFRRTPCSGAWDKLAEDGEYIALGDVYTKDASFPFCVECKKRESWTITGLLNFYGSSPILKWYEKCEEDALKVGKKPLLIFSKAHMPDFVLCNSKDVDLSCADFPYFVLYLPTMDLLVLTVLPIFFELSLQRPPVHPV